MSLQSGYDKKLHKTGASRGFLMCSVWNISYWTLVDSSDHDGEAYLSNTLRGNADSIDDYSKRDEMFTVDIPLSLKCECRLRQQGFANTM